MAIDLITGVPGSGKTYFAVTKLKAVYDTKKRQIFTNINLKVTFNEHLQKLEVTHLYEIAKLELETFNSFKKLSVSYNELCAKKETLDYTLDEHFKNRIDEEIKKFEDSLSSVAVKKNFIANHANYDEYIKSSGLLDSILGSLIVWDECQNDLDELDPVWVRFFSYHRHFSIDMILITQDLSLLHRKYKSFFDKFYYGQNATKRFFSKTLRYKVYNDSREYQKFFIENISLTMQKEILEFYDSGAYQVGKSQFSKFLIVPIILMFVIYFLFDSLFYSKAKKPIDTNSTTEKTAPEPQKQQQQIQKEVAHEKNEDDDKITYKEENRIIELHCNKRYCFLINSRFNVPVSALEVFITGYDGEILYKDSYSKSIKKVYVSLPQSRYEDLKQFEIQREDLGGTKDGTKKNKGINYELQSENKNVVNNTPAANFTNSTPSK